MNESTEKPANEELVARLLQSASDRGLMAHLRRYWSETTRFPYAIPVLGRLQALASLADQIACALFAEHCRQRVLHSPEAPGFGESLRILAGGRSDSPGFESTEKHFRRLLACESLAEVSEQLHRLVKRLERNSIATNYNRLLWDLRKWSKSSESVKTRWAMDFWQAPTEPVAQP